MGAIEPIGSEQKNFRGSEIRNGHILAQNVGVCVEDSYPTALHLGSGKVHWDGWLNVDLHSDKADIRCDLRRLNIASDRADAVCAIHVLEHLFAWEASDLLTEWKRVLKPGGKMILELPCLDKVFAYTADCIKTKTPLMPFMTLLALYGDPKHKAEPMTHKWGYFQEMLRDLLQVVGMREITFMPPRYHFKCRDMRVECVK